MRLKYNKITIGTELLQPVPGTFWARGE